MRYAPMSLYGFPNVESTSIADLHASIAASYRPRKDHVHPRNVWASALGARARLRAYASAARSSSPALWRMYAARNARRAASFSHSRAGAKHSRSKGPPPDVSSAAAPQARSLLYSQDTPLQF